MATEIALGTIGEKLRWLADQIEKGGIEEFDLGWKKSGQKLWGTVFVKTPPDQLVEITVLSDAPLSAAEPSKSDQHAF